MTNEAAFHTDPIEDGHAVRGLHNQTGEPATGRLLLDDDNPHIRWISTSDGVVPVRRDTVTRVDPDSSVLRPAPADQSWLQLETS